MKTYPLAGVNLNGVLQELFYHRSDHLYRTLFVYLNTHRAEITVKFNDT